GRAVFGAALLAAPRPSGQLLSGVPAAPRPTRRPARYGRTRGRSGRRPARRGARRASTRPWLAAGVLSDLGDVLGITGAGAGAGRRQAVSRRRLRGPRRGDRADAARSPELTSSHRSGPRPQWSMAAQRTSGRIDPPSKSAAHRAKRNS